MTFSPSLIRTLSKKAEQSPSTYRISGVALTKRGNVLGWASNGYRREYIEPGRYSGEHCEMRLIKRYGSKIKTIIIMRIGSGGNILPIDPCEKCSKVAEKMGIKIYSIKSGVDIM